MKKYKVAYPYSKRKRPKRLGPVNFEPVCRVCKKPINDNPCCELLK